MAREKRSIDAESLNGLRLVATARLEAGMPTSTIFTEDLQSLIDTIDLQKQRVETLRQALNGMMEEYL